MLNTQPVITEQVFILDASGSMKPQTQSTIDGFNEQIAEMSKEEKEQNVKYEVTLITFNTKARTVFEKLNVVDVPFLSKETYVADGGTALFDTIVDYVSVANLSGPRKNITVITDGQDLNSQRFDKDDAALIIKLRQDENKWGFTYFGANQDAWKNAANIGIGNSLNYSTQNTQLAYRSLSGSRGAYNMMSATNDFRELERGLAVGASAVVSEKELTK